MYVRFRKFGVRTTSLLVLCVLAACAAAQGPNTPTFDPRLNFSTIIREDLFAGFLFHAKDGDERFLRGQKNLEILFAERPQDRPGLTAWKGGVALKLAIDALEGQRMEDFEHEYRRAKEFYAEALRLAPGGAGVMAITGAGFALFADRLPERYRAEGWNTEYRMYSGLWQMQ